MIQELLKEATYMDG